MLYYHFAGGGCSGMWGWCFNAVFNASLLALFVDFHGKSYAAAAKKRKASAAEKIGSGDGGGDKAGNSCLRRLCWSGGPCNQFSSGEK
ncbi:unnamed protein product [Linum tenue]|uniref:Uncharacterized protein n=1 Tax=Linum tenue TaxID=586396 RepID=A0AAV0H8U7_9ROSI|nr:unnamed protein product [Linum tenue]